MTMREYLCREAQRITDESLISITDAEAWWRERPQRLEQYYEMMGLSHYMRAPERPPLNVTITGVIERGAYRIEKLHFESLPRLYVTANLYVPSNIRDKAPAVLYLCGHSQNQKVHYQPHARRFAELGFVTLVIETIQLGELQGYHHGAYRYGWFHWYSRGYTPAGVEVWNGMRAIDLLQHRPEVDPKRIGITGISGGGAQSWFLAAADERVKVSAPVCGTWCVATQIHHRMIDGHCDCMFPINTYRWDMTDIGALIAPRPLLIASADRDWIFDIEAVREVYRKLKRLYELLGASENVKLIETPGAHSYHERSRRSIFAWFMKHLRDEDVPPEEIDDIDDRPEAQESVDALRVFISGAPHDERTTTIQDDFIPIAAPPHIETVDDLKAHRKQLVAVLRKKTFGAFPKNPPDVDVRVEVEQAVNGWLGYRISYTSEENLRLLIHFIIARETQVPAPTLVVIPTVERGHAWSPLSDPFVKGFDSRWTRAFVDVRGVGDTAWHSQLQWHLRRAGMLTGRTIASMRIYDVLRAIEALKRLE
ncbi:MAG TPA: hypothetical protein EYP10_01020, partial [Armatimonadetes bacterium]|nr:hypothetical protein [Armatimonadota bacterium]